MSAPNFIDTSIDPILQTMISEWEAEAGKTLQPAQVERLLINMFAYREGLIRSQFNLASRQMLVNYANGTMLDELGALVGVTRLPATHASVSMEFTFNSDAALITIPLGMRIQTNDGRFSFVVPNDTDWDARDGSLTILCESESAGEAGNGYTAGSISTILDPLPFVISATNTDTSGGGSDPESDDAFRARIKLAPNAFSVAGSRDSYKYFAFSAHPDIIDVAIVSPIPGTVNIYPLVAGGIATPAGVLDAVTEKCSSDKVRPLTDTVNVITPVISNYTITVSVTKLDGFTNSDVSTAVYAALNEFASSKVKKLGQDIVKNAIIAKVLSVPGVYNCSVSAPSANKVVGENEIAVCTGIAVSIDASSAP